MRFVLKRIATACAGALLLACADSPLRITADLPRMEETDTVAARNRQATDLAEQGNYAAAIAVWKELTANAAGPESAYLFRNLGYAHFLNKEYNDSLAALEKACLLDPLNPRGWYHLGGALRKLGMEERAALMFRQAETLERHEFSADYALTKGSRVPAIANAVAAPPRPQDDLAGAVVVLPAEDAVVDLRKSEPPAVAPAVAQPAPVQPAPAAAPATHDAAGYPLAAAAPVHASRAVLLEIRNGNGVRGMAAATARSLGNDELKVVRLTNQKGFNVRSTRIEYEPGYAEAASKLAEKFGAATVVEVKDCWKADMRLVIGKDFAGKRPAVAGARAASEGKAGRTPTST